jgi:DNA replication protein DnaC
MSSEKSKDTKQICEKHGEVLQIISWGDRSFPGSCKQCRAEADKKEILQLEKHRTDVKLRAIANQAKIPERYKLASLSQLKPVCPNARKNILVAERYIADFEENLEMGRCMILSGGVGTGKTHTACSIAREVINRGYRARYTRFPSMMREIKATYGTDENGKESQVISEFTWPHLLVVDEIGIGYGTPYEENTFSDIMAERYDNLRPTILISNLDFAAIERSIGDRNMSRMVDRGGFILNYDWESYRC